MLSRDVVEAVLVVVGFTVVVIVVDTKALLGVVAVVVVFVVLTVLDVLTNSGN